MCVLICPVFLFLQFAGMINARKDGGEYWKGVKKEEFIQAGLVDVSKATSKENNCHSSIGSQNFEPRPNLSAYTDDSSKSLGKDFEPRPNVSAYTEENDESLVKFFEPRPNVSAYNDDGKKEN